MGNIHTWYANRPQSQASLRDRRIGRKVLLADRLSHVMGTSIKKRPIVSWSTLRRPRVVAAFAGAVVVVAVVSSVAHMYTTQAAATQKAEETKQQQLLRQKSIAADKCRQQKASQKAELIGKVTYDELYDKNECDK